MVRKSSRVLAANTVRLGPLDAAKASEAPRPGMRQVGASRTVAQTDNVTALASLLQWQPSGVGGQLAAVNFESMDAQGIRLGILVEQIPPSARIRVYAPGSDTAFDISGSEIMATIQRNLDGGDVGSVAHTYWVPTVGTDEVTLEIELPAGVDASSLKIAVPLLSHLTVSAQNQLMDDEPKAGTSSICEVDISCKSEYNQTGRSVAQMNFVDAGNTYVCTGTLLNDSTSSGAPYFLSADHCISTQSVASSLVTTWLYRSRACNSSLVSPDSRTLTGGAILLYSRVETDTAFMRLNTAPPAGVVYAGWDASTPASTIPSVVGIHHPKGDLQKVSEGGVSRFVNCPNSNGGSYTCSVATAGTGRYLDVRWTLGLIEGGSSGSGLFAKRDGKLYLVGQLRGGTSVSCFSSTAMNVYGRFDIPYAAAIKQWLNPTTLNPQLPPQPIYRFYNTKTGSHFYTISAIERDAVIAAYANFSYEDPVFNAYSEATENTVPVFRFFNTSTGAHFYTNSAVERDIVINTWPVFKYEGVSWYAQADAGGSATPVYRFFNTKTGTHFYTISLAEKNAVEKNFHEYQYENIAYYAWSD